MPDWQVPGYTAMKRIGSGGFGEVLLARHDASGTLVAIKYLRHELLADAESAEMFRSEATVLASLDDPNIVRLYEYIESPSGPAIVMELIGGVSLREILTYQGKTTPEAALVVLQGSLLGLATAHRRGIVHRDYKPENVLVNGDGVSKLTDFGIAARAGGFAVPAGTLRYAAPEQMAGAVSTPAGDIYAATATFYECLTGRPPFRGEADELLEKHRTEPVSLDQVPEPLRPLVAAGMAKDPEAAHRRDRLRQRPGYRRCRGLRPGLAGARPVAPGRGSAPAGGLVAVGRAAHGPGHQRVPGAAAQSCEVLARRPGEGGDRGRHRGRGRGGGHRPGRLGWAADQRSRTSGGGGAVSFASAFARPGPVDGDLAVSGPDRIVR